MSQTGEKCLKKSCSRVENVSKKKFPSLREVGSNYIYIGIYIHSNMVASRYDKKANDPFLPVLRSVGRVNFDI